MRRPRRATRPSRLRTCTPRIRRRVGLGTTRSRRGSARRTRRTGSRDTSARGPPSAAAWVGGPPCRGSATASTRTPPRTAARASPSRSKPPPRARAWRSGTRATATGRGGRIRGPSAVGVPGRDGGHGAASLHKRHRVARRGRRRRAPPGSRARISPRRRSRDSRDGSGAAAESLRAPPLNAGGLLSSRGGPAEDLTFEESALRTREMAHRANEKSHGARGAESARREERVAERTDDDDVAPPTTTTTPGGSGSFYAHGPRPFDPRARASPGAPSAETLELARHRALAAKTRASPRRSPSAPPPRRGGRRAPWTRRRGSGRGGGGGARREGRARPKRKEPEVGRNRAPRDASVSAILFDAEALAAYRARAPRRARERDPPRAIRSRSRAIRVHAPRRASTAPPGAWTTPPRPREMNRRCVRRR